LHACGRTEIEIEPFWPELWAAVFLAISSLRKALRRAKELAERIGITEQNVSLLKSGKVKGVRFDTLAQICEALDCQLGDILEYRDNAAGIEPARRARG
jgi:putative transcriptional regulator